MIILIIGKNGQLGQSIGKIVNARVEMEPDPKPDQYIFVGRDELDLSSKNSINNYFDNKEFDIVINCAAYTSVDKAEEEPKLAYQINHLAIKELALIARQKKSKLIHVSTDYVFDGESDKPYIETDLVAPINIYGKTKLEGERALQEIMPINATIIRTSWLYSEYGNNFVKTMLKIGTENKKISVVYDQIGSPTFATDLSEVILTIVNNKKYRSKDHCTEIYHYSNNGEISWYDFAKEILRLANIQCEVNPVSTDQYQVRAERPRNTLMNKSKIFKDFDLKAQDWRASLEKCINNVIL